MLFIREELANVATQTEEELEMEIQEYVKWVEKLSESGNYLSGDPLEPDGVRLTQGAVVSDGPFIESKEAVTGYILLQAESMEHAISLAKSCPVFTQGGTLELRPIMKN